MKSKEVFIEACKKSGVDPNKYVNDTVLMGLIIDVYWRGHEDGREAMTEVLNKTLEVKRENRIY